ncbi:MAG: TldD/PmbA family protein [Coriobacteriia bacterium]|nr:TldD/PmbA family protein [Coriobacteriia bacterium]
MMLTAEQARELALRAVGLTHADGAEALVTSEDAALTRFADNRIHQNVAESDTGISVRAVVGKCMGVASTNRLDDTSLAACCERAVAAARLAPEDPDFPGLPSPMEVVTPDRVHPSVRAFDASARAEAAAAIIAQSALRDLTAAGTVSATEYTVAVANSLGVNVGMGVSTVRSTVLSMSANGGSGWASHLSGAAGDFSPTALGDEAALLALRSDGAVSLDPGVYTVVLAPEAVSDILDFLGYLGLGAKPYAEESSFLSGKIGQKLLSPLISITDDATSAETLGLTFDFEGMPKQRTPLIDAGVGRSPVTDSYWAAKLGLPNTGHALPAPNPYGPMPMNLEIAAGDARIEDMIGAVKRGVYVTRFHYVNVEDPVRAILTGMTRDGTFLIEDGRLAQPVKNLRFTQSAVDALNAVEAVGKKRTLIGPEDGGANLAPALLLSNWEFTGQTR